MQTRKIASILILMASVGVMIWVFVPIPHSRNAESLVTVVHGTERAFPNLQFQAQLNTAAVFSQTPEQRIPTNNLTDRLTYLYTQQFFNQNKNNLSADGTYQNLQPIPDETKQQLLGSEIPATIDFKQIGLKDIRLSLDDSPKNQRSFIETLSSLLIKDVGGYTKTIADALNDLSQRNDATTFAKFANIASTYSTDLLALAVPPSLKDVHLIRLNLWNEKVAVYQALMNKDTDPLKAYIAAQQIENIINQEGQLSTALSATYARLAN